jgi:uridylate kinase
MAKELQFKRVLLKLSGEALLGDQPYGIDDRFVARLSAEIRDAVKLGASLGIVIGGGNIFRGMEIAKAGGSRVAGDHMGMLATVMNAIALREGLRAASVRCRIFSAMPVPAICETFTQERAEAAMDDGDAVIFAGGTGNPFFTTDSGAALRAAEMGCDALLKGTNVDGIYSADPKRDPSAERYDRLSYDEVLARNLKVMDAAAVALARDNHIPLIVFSIHEPGSLLEVLNGSGRATTVANGQSGRH